MPELRLILLFAGLVVIAAIFIWGRRAESDTEAIGPESPDRQEPKLTNTPPTIGEPSEVFQPRSEPHLEESFWQEVDAVTTERFEPHEPIVAAATPAQANEPATEVDNVPADEKIVALRVISKSTEGFEGSDLAKLLKDEDLRHGQFDIFHRLFKNDVNQTVFSVASLQEPGTFDLSALQEVAIPGLSMFMVLPGPQDGVSAFSDMLATARRIAQQMDGEVQDETGSTLSVQRAAYIRDQIVEYQTHAGIVQTEQAN